MAKKNLKSGTLGGVEWSESEGKDALYSFARDMEVPGVNSRSSKTDIIKALDKASKKVRRATPAQRAQRKKTAAKKPEKALRTKEVAPHDRRQAAKPAAAPPAPTPARKSAVRQAFKPKEFKTAVPKRRARRTRATNRPTGGATKVQQGSSIRKKF